jgi:predicted O-methyltransferase YrrM
MNLNLSIPQGNMPQPPDNRKALYACLLHLRPKFCLEIGTCSGISASIFQRYFNEYCPDGLLVTVDIKQYVKFENATQVYNYAAPWNFDNIIFRIVYPHVKNSSDWHYLEHKELLPDWEQCIETSVENNIRIIQTAYNRPFDFCHIDGDHQETSIRKDLETAKQLLKPPQYFTLDDVYHPKHHDVNKVFKELQQDNGLNIYDFANWNMSHGPHHPYMSLIWNKK